MDEGHRICPCGQGKDFFVLLVWIVYKEEQECS